MTGIRWICSCGSAERQDEKHVMHARRFPRVCVLVALVFWLGASALSALSSDLTSLVGPAPVAMLVFGLSLMPAGWTSVDFYF